MGRNGIDFGDWDKNFNITEWLTDVNKITKKNSSIIIFSDWKKLGDIAKKIESEGFLIKDLIRWIKKNPMPRNKTRRYITDFELAIWATKKNWTFNIDENKPYQRPEFLSSIPKKRFHPTQKPKDLINEIIKIHTNKNDLIFDPFMGSGEICLRAKQNERNFIGCEINPYYFKISEMRIQKEK